jgi:hypothetical protein
MARRTTPGGNTTSRRYKSGRPPKQITAVIGEEAMKTLKILALAANRPLEDEAARLLSDAIADAWQEYDTRMQACADDEGGL